jgi:hypothetical protein
MEMGATIEGAAGAAVEAADRGSRSYRNAT